MSPDTSLVQCTITLDEGTQNLFVRGPDILHNVIVSGYVTFYQISEFLGNLFDIGLLTSFKSVQRF